jgi:hypothetical protein
MAPGGQLRVDDIVRHNLASTAAESQQTRYNYVVTISKRGLEVFNTLE